MLQFCDIFKLPKCLPKDVDKLRRLSSKYPLADGLVIPSIATDIFIPTIATSAEQPHKFSASLTPIQRQFHQPVTVQ
jgi:hypothetical protein